MPNKEAALDKIIESYQDNKKIDIEKLTDFTLFQNSDTHEENIPYGKVISYTILFFPFGGIYYFIKYAFGLGNTERKISLAITVLVISIIELIAVISLADILLGGSSQSLNNLNPANNNYTNPYLGY